MRNTILLLFALLLGACGGETAAVPEVADGYEVYGESFDAVGAVPVEAVVAEPASYVGQPVKLEGTVREVCQAAGCWLTLDAGAEAAPVRLHVARTESGDYAFTVPKDLSGRYVVALGTLDEATLTADMQQHLAADAGADTTQAFQPRPELQLTTQGVLVQRESENAMRDT